MSAIWYSKDLISVSRFMELVLGLIQDVDLLLALVVLVFVESIRVVLIGADNVIVFEAAMLFVYSWCIEIPFLYLVILYIGIKIARMLVTKPRKAIRCPFVTPKSSSGGRIGSGIGLVMVAIGLSALFHAIMARLLTINLLSMIIYVLLSLLVLFKLTRSGVALRLLPCILLVSLPPFGVISVVSGLSLVSKGEHVA
uniref:Uncharacterized protein n=1 Tax=Ignisphaera aggregans TaxID=334771 RepID=A0A7C2Z9C8_9CREN